MTKQVAATLALSGLFVASGAYGQEADQAAELAKQLSKPISSLISVRARASRNVKSTGSRRAAYRGEQRMDGRDAFYRYHTEELGLTSWSLTERTDDHTFTAGRAYVFP